MDFFDKRLEFKKIIFRDKFYYPEEINSSIDKLSSYLKNNKKSNSPFAYLFAYNHIKTIVAYFAIIKSNKICVLVDPELKHIEFGEMMQDTPPYAIINYNKTSDKYGYEKEIKFTDNNIDIDNDQLNDVCTMVYTNAEDGFAKAAMLTRKNIISNAQAILDCDIVNETSVCCALAPFHHLYGLQTGALAPLLTNGSLLIEDFSDLKNFKNIIADIRKYHISNIYSIPIIYYLMKKTPDIRETLKDVTTLVSGGYKLSKKISSSFLEKTGKEIRNGYGLTEASPICTWHRPKDKIKIDSIGKAFSCCHVKVLNNKNEELPINHIGEICIKGDNVMKGYYNNAETTGKILKDSWLHTGDLGRMDEGGYVYLTGMKKKMFNAGGKNIYPAEIERLMKLNENVVNVEINCELSELQEHTVKAKIELNNKSEDSETNFKKWCQENISNYKIPHLIFIKSLEPETIKLA